MGAMMRQNLRRNANSGLEPEIDSVDWQLLTELQENARMSFSELGRRVGLTPPAVAERVRWLEDAGIINGYRLELDVEKLGRPLQALVRLANRGATSAEIIQAISELPEVLECHHVTGEDCYVLRVAVPTVRHLEGTLERLLRFGNTTTSIIVSTPISRRTITGPH
jgi:Lrp/AsnC family leucine-responsive transcriptional regulator